MASEAGTGPHEQGGGCILEFPLEVEDGSEFGIKACNLDPSGRHPPEVDGLVKVEGSWVGIGDFPSLEARLGKHEHLGVLVHVEFREQSFHELFAIFLLDQDFAPLNPFHEKGGGVLRFLAEVSVRFQFVVVVELSNPDRR